MSRHHATVPGVRSGQRSTRRPVDEPVGLKGGFRIDLSDGTWWWSPGMFTLHGYRPDQMALTTPTTRLVLAHRHPADREAMADAWAHLIADGHLVALHYRVIGADGVTRAVFALASTDHTDGRPPTAVTGVLQFEGTA
jgi:hypothetical protein